MTRTRLVRHLSTAVVVVLSASVVVAGVRVSARMAIEPPETAAAGLALRFIEPDPNAIPFPVTDEGPPPPTLPAEPAQAAARAPIPAAITAAHRNARQIEGNPASFHWALLIGINDYAGRTRDNIGSYQDAVALRQLLVAHGWLPDHVLLIGNRSATMPQVREGLKWLASKADARSVVVFHYSGHEKPFKSDVDRDGERRDVGLWLSDNSLMSDGELGASMGRVAAAKMWINMAVCRAGGFDDRGMFAPGRLLTYSSPESELSYEDPKVNYSVFGYNTVVRGIKMGLADLNEDGVVTVQEAFEYGRPLVLDRTGNRQHPFMKDLLGTGFDLRIGL
ncbi:MAG TPA: caspase family protein [Actinomycetota bacterium]